MKQKIVQQLGYMKIGNGNVYDHLCKVMTELTLNQESLDNLQAISFNQRTKTSNEVVYRVRESYSDIKDFEIKNRQLLGKVNIGSAQQPQQPSSFCYIPDCMEQARVFEKFGIGLGEDLTYLVFKSLARMSQKKNAKQVRFWGKILGTEKDYYIAQGQADGGQDPGELSPQTEPKGTGANKSTFWATTNLTGQWTQLPIITPAQIQISRKIKYIFTGNLNRNILTNPLFTGKQAHLLKCQLVRISTTCTIIPRGMFNVNAQNPRQVQAPQQYKYPEIGYLAKTQNWVYHNQSLLNNGRVTWIKPQGIQGDDQIAWNKKMIASDPMQPRLKSIALDSNNWALKAIGLEDTYKTIGKNPKTVSKGVVGIKNTIWPGWVTIAYGEKYSYIYMGYGHKAKQCYYPAQPEKILEQCVDKQQVVIQQ